MTWAFFFIAIIIVTFAMILVSFPAGLYTVFATSLSNSTSASTRVTRINLDLVFTTTALPVAGNLGDVFLVISAIYLGLLLLAAKQGNGLFNALRASVPDGYDALFTNPLAATIVLLGAVSFVTQLLDTVQTSAGIGTGSVTGDPFSLFIDFTLAPLLEETTFRAIMIGLPVLVLAIVIFRDLSPVGMARTLWRPSSLWDVHEDEAGERVHSFKDSGFSIFPRSQSDSLKVRAIRPVVLVFLVLSSVIFGYAHYASGSGWGVGKVSEAALAGLALGYLYVKYGFAANVLLHWSIDYVGSVFSFLAQGLWGVPWDSSTGSPLDFVPTVAVVFLLGIPCTYVVARELLVRVKGDARAAGVP